MKRLLLIVNEPWFFLSHRLAIAQAALKDGYDVHIATGDGPTIKEIERHGFVHHLIPLRRGGETVFSEIKCFIAIWRLLRHLNPDLVHMVTVKPVLYGGLASRLLRNPPAIVLAISGLGTIFLANSFRAKIRRFLVRILYRQSFRHRKVAVIFQNDDDRSTFVDAGIVAEEFAHIISGSGVDMDEFKPSVEPDGLVTVVMASRLLHDKGVKEYCDAARLLKSAGVNARFLLAGSSDLGNPTALTQVEINDIKTAGVLELTGHSSNVYELFRRSHIVVLPSYREGLPRVLIEAAACGRPIVTTDVPGCRHAIIANETGLLVPARDHVALAQAIRRLIDEPALRKRFGNAGRALAEREFSIDNVIAAHMNIYKGLMFD